MNPLSIKEATALADSGAIIIDTRPSAEFVQGFIPGSIHIPLSERFKLHSELILDPDYNAIIIAEDGQGEKVCLEMAKTGVVTVAGYMDGGYDAWVESGGKPDLIIDIDIEEFGIDYKFDEFYLLDTREDAEYEAEHIEHAESIPLSEIEENISALVSSSSYYIYGASFEDAAFAASLFKRNEFHILRVVNVGYEALKGAGIPVDKKRKPANDSKFSDN